MIGLQIDGTEDLLRGFEKYKAEAEKAVNKAVDDTSKAIETDAKKILSTYLSNNGGVITNKSGKTAQAKRGHGGGGLLGSIYNRVVQSMEKVVGSALHYAAYIEFGIGELVFTSKEFSAEEKAVAAQFRGTKKVHGFKGVSYLGQAATNQRTKLVERIKKNLDAIRK